MKSQSGTFVAFSLFYIPSCSMIKYFNFNISVVCCIVVLRPR